MRTTLNINDDLYREVKVEAARRGVSTTSVIEEALRMATVYGAWALAMEHRAGRIVAGRPADLVILRSVVAATGSGDPFTVALDPATTVAATLRRGRVIAGDLPGRLGV